MRREFQTEVGKAWRLRRQGGGKTANKRTTDEYWDMDKG